MLTTRLVLRWARRFRMTQRLEGYRRWHIVAQIPELAENTPRTAHIKLGHVLLPLAADATSSLITFAKSFDGVIRGPLLFRDLFTPAGRVPLGA